MVPHARPAPTEVFYLIDSCPPSPRRDLDLDLGLPPPPPEPILSLDPYAIPSAPQALQPRLEPRPQEEDKSAVPALPNTMSPEERPAARKKHAGGRRKGSSPEEVRRARRAKSNRRSARESRKRHIEYVKELEEEVKELRQQLEFYKVRLGKYEMIEKHRNSFGREVYEHIASVKREMGEKKISDPKLMRKVIAEQFDAYMEERRAAIEQLARAMVEIAAPLPQRFFSWAAENNLDLMDPEKMQQATGNLVSEGQMKSIVEILRGFTPDPRSYNEAKVFYASSSVRLRRLVKGLLGYQRQMQDEMKRVGLFVFRNFLPIVDLERMKHIGQLLTGLRSRPELSDCALYRLTQADFGLSSSFTRSEVGHSMMRSAGRQPKQV